MRMIAFAVLLAAPAFADEADFLSERDGVRILEGWTNATESTATRIFFEIENGGDAPVTLTGGEMTGGARVELVGAPMKVGAEPMILTEMTVEPGGDLALTPETMYLRITGIEEPWMQGDDKSLTVTFAEIEGIEINVEVEDADATAPSHAGHNH